MAKNKNQNKTCGISVIVAMYNAEQYVRQCLDNLLAQTFKDFEVLVVDDCSLDNSYAVVESYVPKFEGRLKLSRMKKNSGCPGMPRNAVLPYARGKYVTFLDSDDFFATNALEELYKVAEETNADVLHSEKFFAFKDGDDRVIVDTYQHEPFARTPTLDTEDIGQRVVKLIRHQTLWWACNKLFRKDFLIKNDIEFPNIRAWEDLVFSFYCIARAKNYVRIPHIFYFYRVREDSLSHEMKNGEKVISYMLGAAQALDRYMGKTKYFIENPEYRYAMMDWYIQGRMQAVCYYVFEVEKQDPAYLYRLFRKTLAATKVSDFQMFASMFFAIASDLKFRNYSEMNSIRQQLQELKKTAGKTE